MPIKILMGTATDKEVHAIGSSIVSVNNQLPDSNNNVEVTGEDINVTVAETTHSISQHLNTLKNDLGDLGNSVTDVLNNAVRKNAEAEQVMEGALNVKGTLTLTGTGKGESLQMVFANGTATFASNNGMEFASPAAFDYLPTTVSEATLAAIANKAFVTKEMLQGAITDVTGSHFDKWVIMGTPDALELTETLQPVYWPATTRFPSLPPSSMEPTEDGTGIKFKKAGLIHIKRKVSLGGANTENLYYEMRIDGKTLVPLQAQAISVSKNTMSYDVEFYWQVSANQTVSIWANCLTDTCNLNYKGVTTLVEYL